MFFRTASFNSDFKTLLNNKKYTISKKSGKNQYQITIGSTTLSVDTTAAREEYDASENKLEVVKKLLSQIDHEFTIKFKLSSLQSARNCLKTILMKAEDIKQENICSDFIDGIKKVVVFQTDDNKIYPLDSKYLKQWGMPKEVIMGICDKNMCDLLRSSDPQISVIAGKIKVIEFNNIQEDVRASVVACSNFKKIVSNLLGSRFLVVIPSNDSILAVEDVNNDVIQIFGPIVMNEYNKSTSRLSTNVYIYNSTGISVAGRFNVSENVMV